MTYFACNPTRETDSGVRREEGVSNNPSSAVELRPEDICEYCNHEGYCHGVGGCCEDCDCLKFKPKNQSPHGSNNEEVLRNSIGNNSSVNADNPTDKKERQDEQANDYALKSTSNKRDGSPASSSFSHHSSKVPEPEGSTTSESESLPETEPSFSVPEKGVQNGFSEIIDEFFRQIVFCSCTEVAIR